jgi:type I restriction enzyme M protein
VRRSPLGGESVVAARRCAHHHWETPSVAGCDTCGPGSEIASPLLGTSWHVDVSSVHMRWIAPASKDTATAALEKRLWAAADELRANSGLTAAQYSQPVLGLIFLRFADAKFAARRAELEKGATGRRGSRVDDVGSYHAAGVLFIPEEARFATLLEFPEGGRKGKTPGQAVDDAMRAIERRQPATRGRAAEDLPNVQRAPAEGAAEGVLHDPDGPRRRLVREDLRVLPRRVRSDRGLDGRRVLHADRDRPPDGGDPRAVRGPRARPACGSGGMFVQSARFVAEHKKGRRALDPRHREGRRHRSLCRLNLAVHGLEGDIRHGGEINSYYDDPHNLVGRFDFVLANPPFNVDKVDKERLEATRSGRAALSVRRAEARQRELPLDPALLRGAERARGAPAS